MAAPARIDELRHRYAAQPRRYLAPLANALRQSGALEEAVTMLRAQLAVFPEHLTGYVVLGQTLFDTGALVEARAAFEQAWALDAGNRVVLRHLGEIASMAGDPAGARMWFGRLRTADPYADDVAAQLGAGASEPPDADTEAPGAVDVDASREVQERAEPAGARAASFELLDFASAEPDATHAAPTRDDDAVLDPVVGLDLPPAEIRPELAASERASGAMPDPALGPRDGAAPAAGLADDDGAAGGLEYLTDGAFATETMAGLLASQGHTEQAIAVYERLVVDRPGDAALRARLDALRGPGAAAPAAPADADPDDAARGALLAAAFADLPTARDVAAFEDGSFGEVSFDEFFPADAGASRGVLAPPEADPDGDLARFDAWLRGSGAAAA